MSVRQVALLSLEPWDQVWRRNQHLAAELVGQGLVDEILFVEPPVRRPGSAYRPLPGIEVLPTGRTLPKRAGGVTLLGRQLRTGPLAGADLLWINDPTLGTACLRSGQPAVYDVTDDWRTVPTAPRVIRRIVHAEDVLAERATTVVCSDVLRQRWGHRYGHDPQVVRNAVDGAAWARAEAHRLPGVGSHIGYVGTLHDERIDVALLLALADRLPEGTVHLIGPSSLTAQSERALRDHPRVQIQGPVAAEQVPGVMRGLDVLICPHRITPFTMSLDAIKSYEYVASGRPIVATPTSGFQEVVAPQLAVVEPHAFVETTLTMLRNRPECVDMSVATWAERARQFRAAWPC